MIESTLRELPPDTWLEPLPDDTAAFEFSFAVKKEALGPHIVARWAWDDDYQRRVHQTRLSEKPFFKILTPDGDIGTVSWLIANDHARFGEFYLLERHQRRGIGSRILGHFLSLADEAGLEVRLECLKWNPVASLYRRNGFVPIRESDIHVFLRRPPFSKARQAATSSRMSPG